MSKQRTSVSLEPEVAEYLQRDAVNASGLVNKLVKEHMAGGRTEDEILEFRIKQVESEVGDLSDRLERKREEYEKLQERRVEHKQEKETEKNQHWKDAVQNIEPPQHLAEYDSLPDRDEWEPPVDNQKVQIYADRLGIEPEEFSTQFPEKWSEYNDN